ncbi:MAG: alpha/beta hydrolase [Alphaproteobacteria bacterium]|nr:alpha/beta hydrolase [Alphaproteobacteria bacterium]
MTLEIDRNFVRIKEGQVHFRSAGNLKSGRPLVMIHASPASAYNLIPLMNAIGNKRPLYAPDTLGNGDSCKAQVEVPDMAYYADAVNRQLDALGLGEVDVYGTHTGGSIAMELGIQQPKRVRRVVIDGIGLYTDEEKKDMLANYTPEIKPDAFGSQFNWAWHFVRDQSFFFPWYKRDVEHQRSNGLASPEQMHAVVMEVLKSITTYHHGYRASFRYPKKDRLPLITQPVLMIYETTDPLFKYKDEAVRAVKRCTEGALAKGARTADKAKLINDWLDKAV